MKEMAEVSSASLQVSTLEQTIAAPPWGGIRALMLAVLEEAIHSLRVPDSVARAEAELWMGSQERRYVFSFAVICETLGLDPSAARRSVMGLLDKKATRGRLLRRSRPNARHNGSIRLASAHGKVLPPGSLPGRGRGVDLDRRLARRSNSVIEATSPLSVSSLAVSPNRHSMRIFCPA